MLKIGDFSTLSKISIHMLRHYDKLGLLVPAHVDHDSGYRYYAENQLTDANRIQALKSMGLGLSTIKEVVNLGQSKSCWFSWHTGDCKIRGAEGAQKSNQSA